MANTRSAKKTTLQNKARQQQNLARRTAIKNAIKKTLASLAEGAELERTTMLLRDVASQLARAKGKRVMHPNTAARKLSRLAKKVAAAAK